MYVLLDICIISYICLHVFHLATDYIIMVLHTLQLQKEPESTLVHMVTSYIFILHIYCNEQNIYITIENKRYYHQKFENLFTKFCLIYYKILYF